MVNALLLRKELEFIKALPDAESVKRDADGEPLADHWNQSLWYRVLPDCGSAGCFAGFTAAHAGLVFTSESGIAVWADSLPEPLVEKFRGDGELERHVVTGRAFVWTADAAALVLGLMDDQAAALFAASNTLDELEGLVKHFIAEPEPASGAAEGVGR